MTSGRYFLARLALAFGISRRQKRMADAAAEAHLLREAEQHLGAQVWMEVENVEELGIEYWNLRRLQKKRDELTSTLAEAEAKLRDAHDERSQLLSAASEKNESIIKERAQLVQKLESLARERDAVVVKAREVRRVYDGMKAKLEVLKQEESTDEESAAKSRQRMTELREQFDGFKTERDRIAAEVKNIDAEVTELDKRLEADRKVQREDTSGTFHVIGDMNREISRCKAELGVVETEMYQLYAEIGRHVSLHARRDEACRKATAKFRPMVEVIAALRRSISLNHRLSNAS